jgi:DNA-binding Xre family transcriptional regulator
MQVKLKNPIELREMLARKGLFSQEEIADTIKLSTRTVSKILSGNPMRYGTARKIAKYLDVNEMDIAEIVRNDVQDA